MLNQKHPITSKIKKQLKQIKKEIEGRELVLKDFPNLQEKYNWLKFLKTPWTEREISIVPN